MLAPSLLLLADGRFPTGGHVHSYGLEAAVRELGVADIDAVVVFLRGRLSSVGLVDAALAASAARLVASGAGSHAWPELDAWLELDAEASARIASPALRMASRRAGRQLLRTAATVFGLVPPWLPRSGGVPSEGGLAEVPHHAVALGWVAGSLGADPLTAATLVLHHLGQGVATAAVRLLALDPAQAQAGVASLAGLVADLAAAAGLAAAGPAAALPAAANPLAELLAEAHAATDAALFVT